MNPVGVISDYKYTEFCPEDEFSADAISSCTTYAKLESLTRHETLSIVRLHLYSDGSSICYIGDCPRLRFELCARCCVCYR